MYYIEYSTYVYKYTYIVCTYVKNTTTMHKSINSFCVDVIDFFGEMMLVYKMYSNYFSVHTIWQIIVHKNSE